MAFPASLCVPIKAAFHRVKGHILSLSKRLFPTQDCPPFKEGRKVGRREGRMVGRKKGRREESKEGRNEGRKEGRKVERKEGRKQGRKE